VFRNIWCNSTNCGIKPDVTSEMRWWPQLPVYLMTMKELRQVAAYCSKQNGMSSSGYSTGNLDILFPHDSALAELSVICSWTIRMSSSWNDNSPVVGLCSVQRLISRKVTRLSDGARARHAFETSSVES
jgi:hypothetical protein